MNTSPWIIEWSDALSMSNPEIDAEHQHCIGLVNQLNKKILSQQQDKAVIEHIMGLILMDAVAHFAHEERLFVENNYPAAQEHAQIHSEAINKFKQALKEIQSTNIRAVWVKEGVGIKNLLVAHLLNEDTKYIEYLQTE
jgi:hemerythrin-like metal-binding protein